MNWLRVHRRTAWICGLTLLAPLLLYLNGLFGLWGMRQAYQAEIDRLAPRIGRQQGLMAYEDELRKAAAAGEAQVLGLVYPATADRATVSAELQTNVRDIFGQAGLSVTNSLVMPVRERGSFDYVAVKLTLSGELAALDEALVGIANYLPLLLVESIDVSPARVRRARASRDRGKNPPQQQLVTANLQLLSLRVAQ